MTAAMLLVIYIPVIHSEEEFLRARFSEFNEYCHDVPRLFPRLRAAKASAGKFSGKLYWKHREYNAALGAAAIVAILIMKRVWLR